MQSAPCCLLLVLFLLTHFSPLFPELTSEHNSLEARKMHEPSAAHQSLSAGEFPTVDFYGGNPIDGREGLSFMMPLGYVSEIFMVLAYTV